MFFLNFKIKIAFSSGILEMNQTFNVLFIYMFLYCAWIVCSGSVRIEVFISFRFITWLESLAEWKVNYFPGILVLFCELKPKFSHKNFKNAKRHHAKQGCFWSCQVCLYSKAMQCEFFPAFFLVGILIVCMQCGMVCKQIMSFCSSLDKGKTQMFDFSL